jgi:hypothetical protein
MGACTWSAGSVAAGCECHAAQLLEEWRRVSELAQEEGIGQAMLTVTEWPAELTWLACDGVARAAHVQQWQAAAAATG